MTAIDAPTSAAAAKRADRADALDRLRKFLPAGSTVSTMTTRVSSSGMSRNIVVLIPDPNFPGEVRNLSSLIIRAGIFPRPRGQYTRGVCVGGGGMDMHFHLVYTLSHVLHGSGDALRVSSL